MSTNKRLSSRGNKGLALLDEIMEVVMPASDLATFEAGSIVQDLVHSSFPIAHSE